ncbi:MAG: FAD-dependent oxidoreductase [Mycobacterium sp.]|nr:FAD-dependent oxidoreductase [Mycobacterium sp.]
MIPGQRSIAVIGSGVAGLTAGYELAKRDRVTLFEADTRLGGHAHTHQLDDGTGNTVSVDSAFLVHNDRTYPTLCRLFDELGVRTQDSDMSMSVRCDANGLEYAGARGITGLFPTAANLRRPRYLAMLAEVKKFHRAATRLLRDDGDADTTLAVFVARNGFSPYFVDHFLTPLVAAVWSCPPESALEYPARYLFTFLDHHGMLTVFGSPVWRTVVGGSATYVRAIAETLDAVHTGTPVRSVRRTPAGVQVILDDQTLDFDAAVIATHSDQALTLMAAPTDAERRVLGAIRYSANHTRLHTDDSVLPRHRRARASWNYLITPRRDEVVVTYDVTRLMRLNTARPFLVTLGGEDLIDPASVLAEMTYHHPLYTPESLAAQRQLAGLDDDRVVFAGAYHGWGFHEDGAAAGLRAAQLLRRDPDRAGPIEVRA